MEDALAPDKVDKAYVWRLDVLILVVMEDALAPHVKRGTFEFIDVLILVVMEDALAPSD